MPRQVQIFEKSEYLQDQACPTPQKLIQPDPAQFWTLSRAGATHLHIWFYSTEGGQRLGSYLCSPHWHHSLSSPKILSKQVGRRCHKELFFPESMGEKRGPISGWVKRLCLLPPACCGPGCWGKQNQGWGETHPNSTSGTTGPGAQTRVL